jgi:hypothetical protein
MKRRDTDQNPKAESPFLPEPNPDWREIARCPEFILYETPSGSKEVAVARTILELESVVYFSNNSSEATTTQAQRALLADALLDWGKLQNPTDAEAAAIFRTLHQIIGPKIREAGWGMNTEAEAAAKSAAATFKQALKTILKEKQSLEPRGGRIIFEAIHIFRKTEKPPRKSAIRSALEEDGERPWFTGKNAGDTWNDWFNKLGLGGLPK